MGVGMSNLVASSALISFGERPRSANVVMNLSFRQTYACHWPAMRGREGAGPASPSGRIPKGRQPAAPLRDGGNHTPTSRSGSRGRTAGVEWADGAGRGKSQGNSPDRSCRSQTPDAGLGQFDRVSGGIAQVDRPATTRPVMLMLDGLASGLKLRFPSVQVGRRSRAKAREPDW